MKLLLDAPEHLWRLIERREYYRATWLFLLSRGVHRALTHDDATEGSKLGHEGYINHGILVTLQRRLGLQLTVFIGSVSSRTTAVGNGCPVQAADISQSDTITYERLCYRLRSVDSFYKSLGTR
jgi:hypothetical protein